MDIFSTYVGIISAVVAIAAGLITIAGHEN